jgi:thymidylate kinase
MLTVTRKYRFIVVEGPDCSGKSTLVERLKNSLHWDSKYLRHAKKKQFFRYLGEYATQKNTIFDRAHFSEEVYSHMWRGGSPFLPEEKRILDEICHLHALTIFCLPSKEDMIARYNSRDFDQQITLPEMIASYEAFESEAKKSGNLIYKSQNYAELDELISKVKEMVE